LKNKIKIYLDTHSRNKIIIHQNPLEDIDALNLGYILSKSIIKLKSKLSLKTITLLEKQLNDAIIIHPYYGKILAIKNLGVLFEPELKINIYSLFDKFSKNNALFVEWEGDIENKNFFFLNKSDKINLNLNNLSHIIL
jgi:phage pi2 protein 07